MSRFELKGAIITFRPDGIVHVDLRPEIDLGIPEIDEIMSNTGKWGGGLKYPTLITGGKFIRVDPKVRAHYSKACAVYSKADAFVANSLPERMLANFYIRFNKPVVPTYLFRDEYQAVSWLKQYL